MSAGKMECDCGCGVSEHFNKLQTVEIEKALDESLRQTSVAKRFLVRRVCYQDFIEELQAKVALEALVRSYAPLPWYRRITQMRRVVRLQFLIHIRLKGIERTKRISTRAGVMFAAPQIVAAWFDRYWRWADKHQLVFRWARSA